ncbi:hypothetical protein [Clostridium sp. Marseille-P2415]|uniref:hypothetical protein n=1 Tax=Clostridium sp. Marseille-P2415 TaxID=1805471 RepID=UPI0009883DDE|nr:hypothetical protein [Clostridium sp. Marseille-P2415]
MQSPYNTETELFLCNYFSSQTLSVNKHQLIYHSFDKNDLIGKVVNGCVCFVLVTPDSGERIIAYYEKDEYFTSNLLSCLNYIEVYGIISSTKSVLNVWKA